MDVNNENIDDVRQITQYATSQYDSLDLNRLAVVAIWVLHNNDISTHFENLVVALYKMFPAKFALDGFPEYPDSSRIRRSLLQLRPKYRNWAYEDSRRGRTTKKVFVLNQLGQEVANEARLLMQKSEYSGGKRVTPKLPPPLTDELKEIERSHLYEMYQLGETSSIDRHEVLDMLHAFPYTPAQVIKGTMKRLQQAAKDMNRQDITEFLKWVKSNYPELF
ncbi:MAG: hypothetical protein GY861_04135 [bacterium]|nr:hypothetical protein [bacterium]